MPQDAEEVIRLCNLAFEDDERNNAENSWAELGEFLLNNQSGTFHQGDSQTKGGKKMANVFASQPLMAVHNLSAALHSTLTSPAVRWAKFRYSADNLNDNSEALEWLEDSNKKFHEFLNTSNFDTEISKAYRQYTTYGSMAFMMEELPKDDLGRFTGFNFTTWDLAELAWQENHLSKVETVYRKFKMTVRQAINRWGDKLDPEVHQMFDIDPSSKIEIVHCMSKRDDKDIRINELGLAPPESRPFMSMYVDKKRMAMIEEDGFYEFPLMVARWETAPGEAYGRGQGHIAIPDVLYLNTLKRLALVAKDKAVNPTVFVEAANMLSELHMRPGYVNFVRDLSKIPVEFRTSARFDLIDNEIKELQAGIEKIFFVDKLMLPPRTETGEQTAFEISVRLEDVQRIMGPTLGRINGEVLDPTTQRGFNIMLRAGALEELPEVLKSTGTGINVEYVNQLARAQKLSEVTNIKSWLGLVAEAAQLDPNVLVVANVQAAVMLAGKIQGVPESIIRSEEEIEALLQQKAQQEQQQQQLDQATQVADIAGKVGKGGVGEK